MVGYNIGQTTRYATLGDLADVGVHGVVDNGNYMVHHTALTVEDLVGIGWHREEVDGD